MSDDLDAFLHAAEVSNIAIIGIEGFDVEGDKVVPDTDAIADFSGLPHDNDRAMLTIGEARLFLQRVSRPGMYFDFEVDDSGDGI